MAQRELSVRIGVNTGSADSKLKALNTNIKASESAFKNAGAGVKDFEKTTEGMKAKLEHLGNGFKAQSQKVDVLKKAISDTKVTLDESNKSYETQNDKVAGLAKALESAEKTYGKNSKEVKALAKELEVSEKSLKTKEKAVISVDQKLTGLESSLNNTEADMKKLKSQIDDTNKSLNSMNFEKIGKNLSEVGNNVKSVGDSLSGFGSKMMLGVTAPIMAIAGVSAKAGNALKEMQQKSAVVFGNMVDDVRVWSAENERTFGLGAGTIEGYTSQIADLTQGMGLAKDASLTMAKGVVDIGVKLANWGNTGAPEAMEDIKKAVAGSHEAVEKYGIKLNDAVLTEKTRAMGLGDTFNKLTEAEKAQVRYEAIVSSSQNAIDYWNEGNRSMAFYLGETKEQLMNVAENIGNVLLPVISEVTKKVADASAKLAKWSAENPELVATITKVALAIALIAPAILIIGKVIGVIGTVMGAFGALSTAIAGAGGVMAFFTASILPVILTIGGVILAVVLLYNGIKSNFDGIKEALINVKTAFMENLEPMKEAFSNVWLTMQDMYEAIIVPLFTAIGEIIQVVIQFIADIMPGISDVFTTVCSILTAIWDSVGKPVFDFIMVIVGQVVDFFKEYMPMLSEVFNSVMGTLKNLWDTVGKPLFDIIKVIIEACIETLKPIISSLMDAFGSAFRGIKSVWDNILKPVIDLIASVIGKMVSVVSPHMDTFKSCISTAMDFVLKPIQWVIDKFGDLMDVISWAGDKVGGFLSKLNPFKSIDMGVNVDTSGVTNLGGFEDIALSGQVYNSRTPMAQDINSMISGEVKVDNNSVAILETMKNQNTILMQMVELLVAGKEIIVQSDVVIDGRAIAKSTAKFMEKEISTINKRSVRLGGAF